MADDGRRLDRGPHRRRGRRRDDHSDRLRQADEDRPLPRAEARRQGRPGRAAAAGRHRRALLRLLDARLDPVLHEQGPGLPAEGLRAAGGEPQRPRPARGEPARVPAGRADRPGHADQGLPGGAVPGAGHAHGAGEEDAARRTSTRTAPAASSRSTCATTTSWSAPCCAPRATTCCWSPQRAQSIRFNANDEALRPMGRATSGVLGMRFNDGDRLLALAVVRDGHVRVGRHRRAGTPSAPRSRTTRCRVGAARAC